MRSLVVVSAEQQARAGVTRTRQMAGAGVSDAGRAVLREHGPLTVEELAQHLAGRYSKKTVWAAFSQVKLPRGVFCDHGAPCRYDVKPFVREVAALPVREFRPLKRDPFAAWRLCERDPFEGTRSAVFSSRGCA